MKRTTVKLPEDLDAKLRAEAQRRGITTSELTREAIEAHLGVGRRRVLHGAGSFRSETGDLSIRVDEIFGEILEEKRRKGEL